MQLSQDEIQKVAMLARLEFSESELALLSAQMEKIVLFVEQLNELSTEGVEPLAHALDVHSVVRADQLEPSLAREAALANSPAHDDECFLVPPVMARQ